MPAYTPPPPPPPSGLPLTDVQLAYDWTQQFFGVRTTVMRFIASAILGGVSRLG